MALTVLEMQRDVLNLPSDREVAKQENRAVIDVLRGVEKSNNKYIQLG